eukprot:PhM_4_TR4958/c0_g1_i1/m.106546
MNLSDCVCSLCRQSLTRPDALQHGAFTCTRCLVANPTTTTTAAAAANRGGGGGRAAQEAARMAARRHKVELDVARDGDAVREAAALIQQRRALEQRLAALCKSIEEASDSNNNNNNSHNSFVNNNDINSKRSATAAPLPPVVPRWSCLPRLLHSVPLCISHSERCAIIGHESYELPLYLTTNNNNNTTTTMMTSSLASLRPQTVNPALAHVVRLLTTAARLLGIALPFSLWLEGCEGHVAAISADSNGVAVHYVLALGDVHDEASTNTFLTAVSLLNRCIVSLCMSSGAGIATSKASGDVKDVLLPSATTTASGGNSVNATPPPPPLHGQQQGAPSPSLITSPPPSLFSFGGRGSSVNNSAVQSGTNSNVAFASGGTTNIVQSAAHNTTVVSSSSSSLGAAGGIMTTSIVGAGGGSGSSSGGSVVGYAPPAGSVPFVLTPDLLHLLQVQHRD